MRYLKPFILENSKFLELKQELQDFCETSLAYLIDDGVEVQVLERPGIET